MSSLSYCIKAPELGLCIAIPGDISSRFFGPVVIQTDSCRRLIGVASPIEPESTKLLNTLKKVRVEKAVKYRGSIHL